MKGIVLHYSRSVYWPIPKNACTTLKVHFINLLGIPCGNNPHRADFEWTNCSIDGYSNWALVRNPYSRLYSLWVNKIAPGHPVQPSWPTKIDKNVFHKVKNIIHSEMSFENFVEVLLNSGEKDQHWDPQSEMIPDNCFVTKMEEFQCLNIMFPTHNKSHLSTCNWQKEYSEKTQRLVQDYYTNDFERFGYSTYPVNRLLVDCDGVLTDGRLTIDHNGEKQFKQFNTRDVRAIREFVFNGWEVILVSADDWPGLKHFAKKVGAEFYYCHDKSCLPFENYIAVGDDAWDVCMLEKAYKGFIPSDADESVGFIENIKRLKTAGGQGIVAELARILL